MDDDVSNLVKLVGDLTTRIRIAESGISKKVPDPEFLRCMTGPWLSRRLIPRIDKASLCRFLKGFQENRTDFLQRVAEPLIGEGPLNSRSEILAKDDSLIGRIQIAAGRQSYPFHQRLLRGLELRLATFMLLEDIAKPEVFRAVSSAYQEFFGTRCWKALPQLSSAVKSSSAAFSLLTYHNPSLATAIQSAIDAQGDSFFDPAIAFLIDTICLASGWKEIKRPFATEEIADGSSWRIGETWVMATTASSSGSRRGMVMRLRIEPVEFEDTPDQSNITGIIYPHPHLAAHFCLSETFQTAIRNAWIATRSDTTKCDCRWSLIPLDDSTASKEWKSNSRAYYDQHQGTWEQGIDERDRHQCLWTYLDGDSATLAYGIALKSVQEKIPLRWDLAATSSFQLAGEDCQMLTIHARLQNVGGIPAKQDALERAKIKQLLVATNQSTTLPFAEDRWVKKPTFAEAFEAATEIEMQMEEYCSYSGTRWEEIENAGSDQSSTETEPKNAVASKVQVIDIAVKQAKEHRLDWYVHPEYTWLDHGTKAGPSKERAVPGDRKDQLLRALKEWYQTKDKHLLLMDDAGAGKTICSYRMQFLMGNEQTRKEIFGDDLCRFVVHWSGKLPDTEIPTPKLLTLLLNDPLLELIEQRQPSSRDVSQKVLEYAINQGRLIVIIDAWDELHETSKSRLASIIKDNHRNIRFVITSRDYAVKEELAIPSPRIFDPKAFLVLQLKPFTEDLQDEFMRKAIGDQPWRTALQGPTDGWDELLGLPYTLSEIAKFFLEFGDRSSVTPSWISPSDLFVDCARRMIQRELSKEENLENIRQLKNDLNDRSYPTRKLCDQVERVLGAVALEMAIDEQWREVNAKDQSEKIESIWANVERRFFLLATTKKEQDKTQFLWDWAKDFSIRYQLHKGSTQGDFTERSLTFRNRRVQEMWAARYITHYVMPKELNGGTDISKAIDLFVGDERWENLWKSAARMPLYSSQRSYGADASSYQQAISLLFEVPKNRDFRRPTECMWYSDSILDIQVKMKVPNAAEIAGSLHKILTERFHWIRENGTDGQKTRITELLNPENYLLLCSDKLELRLPRDSGHFRMGPDPDYPREGSVAVQLSPFGIGRFMVTEEQFTLFDPGSDVIFKGLRKPATSLSWYDCFYFVKFLADARVRLKDGREYRFRIPTEAQGEYATRAGSKEDYFIGQDGEEVTEQSLGQYAVFYGLAMQPESVDTLFKLPNAWGLMHPVGNVWQWRWDWYAGLSEVYPKGQAQDPRGASEGFSRVLRGGSWFTSAATCRSANRYWFGPTLRSRVNGFRLALSSSGTPN